VLWRVGWVRLGYRLAIISLCSIKLLIRIRKGGRAAREGLAFFPAQKMPVYFIFLKHFRLFVAQYLAFILMAEKFTNLFSCR